MRNKQKKAILSGTLALLLALPVSLFGCGEDTATTPDPSAVTTAVETTQAPETGPVVVTGESIVKQFDPDSIDGTFTILCSDAYNTTIYVQQAPGEVLNGDIINDSLFRRDLILSEHFGIDIDYVVASQNSEINTIATISLQANEHVHDVIFASMRKSLASFSLSGYLYDLNEVETLNLEAEWWSKRVQQDLSIGDKLFFASGDITTRYMTTPYIVCFNEEMLRARGMELPYDDVFEGTWTMEKLSQMTIDQYQDLNQDGVLTDDDLIALNGPGDAYDAFLYSADQHIVILNEEGIPCVNESESLKNHLDFLKECFLVPGVKSQDAMYTSTTAFAEGRGLFLVIGAGDLQLLGEMTEDYGIVPYPKKDETQENYISAANPFIATGVAIPFTAPDAERIGAFIEAMAAVSRYTSSEAMYENLLLIRQTRNENSADCLRIAAESLTYDMGKVYTWAEDLLTSAKEYFLLDGMSYSTALARFKNMFNRQIERAVEKILD